jgi:hypothetical protein
VQNYFNYFTEIEEHFQRRRGSLLLLSTLDWALIETWREAGIPLAAVVRGIDAAFDKYDARKAKGRARRVNGLAYCMQEVMTAVEDMKEASVGTAHEQASGGGAQAAPGFEQERIAAHLRDCAAQLDAAKLAGVAAEVAQSTAIALRSIAEEVLLAAPSLEDLERRLTVMEEKQLSALTAMEPEPELITLREESARSLAPYRARMNTTQIRQIEQQFLHKRLLEKHNLPRLSLFYMSQA